MRFILMAIVASMLAFTACETEDFDDPVITLTGDAEMDIVLNVAGGFVEPGFAAEDNKDGDLTANVIVTGVVDPAKIGTYTLTYSVSDKAGNKGTVTRKVNVIVNQASYTGTWNVKEVITGDNPDPNWMYTATVTASATNQMRILIANFGGGTGTTANVDFDKFGKFTIANQPFIGTTENGTIEGDGISSTSPGGDTLTIKYKLVWATSGTDYSTGTWVKAK